MSDGSADTLSALSSDELTLLRAVAHAPDGLPEPLLVGRCLGRYRIDELLGRGAAGVVYAAVDTLLEREVALKVLRVSALSEQARLRGVREARALARVRDRRIALVYDVEQIDDQLVIAMERVRGQTLRAYCASHPALRPDAIAELGARMARALHAAHAAGVVHRDVKPDNVMVDAEGEIKILDFGLAHWAGAGERREGWAGTRGYAAPEGRLGVVEARGDQYALGVILSELLDAADARSPRLRRIVARCTALDPEQRYPSCAALAQELEAARRRVRARRPLVLLALLVVVVGLFMGPVVSPRAAAPSGRWSRALGTSQPAVACPPLDTPRVEEGWLGAAAASALCRRVRALLGGDRARVLAPGELLELPRTPSEDFPVDPWTDPASRPLTLAAAADHWWIDGRIERTSRGFAIALILRDPSGAERASAAGQGGFASAVAQAVDGLVTRDGLHTSPTVSARVALWSDVHSVSALVALTDAEIAHGSGGDAVFARARLASCAGCGALGDALLRLSLSTWEGVAADDARGPAPTDLVSIVRQGPYRAGWDGSTEAAQLAGTLAQQIAEDSSLASDPTVLATEASLRASAGDASRARQLALAAADLDPWDGPWGTMALSSFQGPGFQLIGRAYAAWQPEVADAWNIAGHADRSDLAHKIELIERAYLLGDGFPLFGGNYGQLLALAGRTEEARAVAAVLSVGAPGQRIAGYRLAAEIDLAEGKVAAAFERGEQALASLDSVGGIEKGDIALLGLHVELGVILGRNEEAAEKFFDRFVAPNPTRLDPGPFAAIGAAHACAYASREIAARCFEVLTQLLSSGWFGRGITPDTRAVVEGARAYAAGEYAMSAAAFRRVRSSMSFERSVAALAFERSGDLARADQIDPPNPGLFGGASQSYLRAARRELARGNCQAARTLASRLVEAWSSADTTLRTVAEAKQIVSACPA